ncbi:MAG: SpoIID/LytB domain-containing protein [Nitrospirae bacterium]|nr:SpoIID/LytB domain-containing protein [Nitrospirota bacterium]
MPSYIYAKEANKTLSPEYLAQWNISYASYLIDTGKYLEALEAFETALDATDNKSIKGTILMNKATLLSTYLDAPADAIKIYDTIIKEYPDKTETALHQMGIILLDQGHNKDAIEVFLYYLKKYPNGRFRSSIETLYKKAKGEIVPPSIIKEGVKIVEPIVRVLLQRKVTSIELSGKNLVINEKGYSEGSVVITFKNDMLYIRNIPLNEKITIKASSPIKVSSGNDKKTVRGEIICSTMDKGLSVINNVSMEEYLRSVVPSESYSKWSIETLKAQAIAARTYAYYQILHRTEWTYDVVDNEGDQAYKGISVETQTTDKAVAETSGIIAINDGKPILAMYTSNNGGYIADAGAIFNLNKPYFVSKPDSYSVKGDKATWNKKVSVSVTESYLQRSGINVSGLTNIVAAEKDVSGRVIKINIIARIGSGTYRTRPTIGHALDLPEILFEITKEGDYFIFAGKGWGHGVGYSQWGSAIMGQEENDYKTILAFYYPETELIKIW